MNWGINGFVNIPMAKDQLALRVTGYHNVNQGFIDNLAATFEGTEAAAFGAPAIDEEGVGDVTNTGVRASILFDNESPLNVRATYIYEESETDGRLGARPDLPVYTQARFGTNVGPERFRSQTDFVNLTADYDFGPVNLLSTTTYRERTSFDNRNFLGTFFETLPISQGTDVVNQAFIQEVRLTSTNDSPLQYILGFFYEDIDNSNISDVQWNGNPATNFFDPFGAFGTEGGIFRTFNNTSQTAVFGEASYEITDRLTLTGGARVFDYDVEESRNATAGYFLPDTTAVNSEAPIESGESNESYKLNLTYDFGDNSLIYAQYSEGFRLGRPLAAPTTICDANQDGIHDDLGLPFADQLDSDFTKNYEGGVKLSALDGRVQVNASAFHIDWVGIPVFIGISSPCGTGLNVNAGSARSQGVELEAAWAVTDALTLDYSFGYTDAQLEEDAQGFGAAGDRLPGSPEFSTRLGARYGFDLMGRESFFSADAAYVSEFYNNLEEIGEEAGDYVEVNAQLGVDFGDFDATLYVANLTGEDAFQWVDTFPPNVFYLRPRTFGLRIGADF
ncbi:MAG: TonB-dependent receptor [Pseudomonadota bacterium]